MCSAAEALGVSLLPKPVERRRTPLMSLSTQAARRGGPASGDVIATTRSTLDGTSARLGYVGWPCTEGCPGWTIKVEPRNSLLRKAERVCWPTVASSSPMIATVLGLKIGSREPAFPNDALGEPDRSFGRRIASADMLLTAF